MFNADFKKLKCRKSKDLIRNDQYEDKEISDP